MDANKRRAIPAKILIGLALCVLLGLGLCSMTGMVHNETATGYFFVAGAVCFWGGLAALFLFGIGWAIFAIGKSIIGKKD